MNNLIGEKQYFSKWLSLLFFLFLLLHFTITILYNFQYTGSFKKNAQFYMEPLFTQNFRIFAPDAPVQTIELYIKVDDQTTGWSKWQNPSKPDFYSFQKNRFSPKRYTYLIYTKAAEELRYVDEAAKYYATKEKITAQEFNEFRKKYLLKSTEYLSAKKSILSYLKQNGTNQKIRSIKCCLIYTTRSYSNVKFESATSSFVYTFF